MEGGRRRVGEGSTGGGEEVEEGDELDFFFFFLICGVRMGWVGVEEEEDLLAYLPSPLHRSFLLQLLACSNRP